MSRRRGAPRESWVPDSIEVAVVCLGRRRHTRVDFGSMLVHPDGRTHERLKIAEYAGEADLEAGVIPKTIPFVCRRCSPFRNVPLKRETLDVLCRGLANTDTPILDLSALGATLL